MYYVNNVIKSLNRVFDQNSRSGFLRLDLNENPGGLPQEFIDTVLSEVTPELVSKYPETDEFQHFLADKIGVEPDEICLTNGSAEAIRYAIELFSRPKGKVVSVTPAYAMYEVFSLMYDREFVPVSYSGKFKFDVNDIIDVLDESIDLLVVMNPNNPVGDSFSEEEICAILDKSEECNINVIIDEAYYYFCPISFQKYAMSRDNVILTRTFSKLFSLAGCRLGYCIGKKENVKLIQKMCTPHNVNAFALRFAQKIISTDGMLENLITKQLEGRAFLINELRAAGYNVNDSRGNFVFIETKRNAKVVQEELRKRKILVKHYSGFGYNDYIRVTTAEKKIMEQFLVEFYDIEKNL